MDDRLSKILMLMNDEFIKLDSSKPVIKARRKENILNLIKHIRVSELLNILSIYINRKAFLSSAVHKWNYVGDLNPVTRKVAVYTCIIGNYDLPKEPVYVSDLCDYYLYTDAEVSESSVWKKRNVDIEALRNLNNYEKNRYIKMRPHALFDNYEYSVYIDGNIQIIADIVPIIESMGRAILAVSEHPNRGCIYQEGRILKYSKRLKEYYLLTKKQLQIYKTDGYPKENGMFENTVIIRKHNDPKCVHLMDMWWEEYSKYPTRDQISLPYITWKHNINKEDIYIFSYDLGKNPRFRRHSHN